MNANARSGDPEYVRYTAPEFIEGIATATTNSDTFPFAMVVLVCEEVPFSEISRDAAVIHARVTKRENPPSARRGGPGEAYRLGRFVEPYDALLVS